jgi:hypothetical protein
MSGILVGPFVFPINVSQRAYFPNHFDRCLWNQQKVWERLNAQGGLKQFCAGMKYRDPPWIKMPAQGKRFQNVGSISLPAADGADHVVLSFLVPHGFDGVGTSLVQNYTGAGFVEGSGDLTWRIQLNMRYPKDLGMMTTQVGSLNIVTPTVNAGNLLLQSDQLVQYIVNRSVASSGTLIGGRIVCAILGWNYPRGVHVP